MFTQEQLNEAVQAERERCYAILRKAIEAGSQPAEVLRAAKAIRHGKPADSFVAPFKPPTNAKARG